jgi:hypothetical protein
MKHQVGTSPNLATLHNTIFKTDAAHSSGGAFQRAAEAGEAGLGGFLEGVLPDAEDFPSIPAELAVHAFIAGHVVFSFLIPKLPVGFGAGVALRTSVPETSVDKDGELLPRKGKVGLSG